MTSDNRSAITWANVGPQWVNMFTKLNSTMCNLLNTPVKLFGDISKLPFNETIVDSGQSTLICYCKNQYWCPIATPHDTEDLRRGLLISYLLVERHQTISWTKIYFSSLRPDQAAMIYVRMILAFMIVFENHILQMLITLSQWWFIW